VAFNEGRLQLICLIVDDSERCSIPFRQMSLPFASFLRSFRLPYAPSTETQIALGDDAANFLASPNLQDDASVAGGS
jgi:hypothetical protein